MFPLLLLLVSLFIATSEASGLKESNIIVKRIKTADGDIFDCVDIYKQPSLSHPLLKDHKVQIRPSMYSVEDSITTSRVLSEMGLNDGGCPEGSVPVAVDRLLQHNTSMKLANSFGIREYIAERRTSNGRYNGGAANLNVYSPPVGNGQVSSSRINVVNKYMNIQLQAGWMVNPVLFKDSKSRLFISSFENGKLCINLNCGGFVQTNSKIFLGGVLSPVSRVSVNTQYYIEIYIHKDLKTGDWWVSMNSQANSIGYWPKAVVNYMNYATQIQYGGYTSCYGKDTCPQMGNGLNPTTTRNADACFISEVQYFDASSHIKPLKGNQQYPSTNKRRCYDVGTYLDLYGKLPKFSFGGNICSSD